MGTSSSIGVLAQVFLCVALLSATTGCGGGGSSAAKTTTIEPAHTVVSKLPTQAHFIGQLDALCHESHQLTSHRKALTRAIKANDLKQASAIVASTRPEAVAFYVRYERVIPSAEGQTAFVRYLVLTHRYVGLNELLAAALHAHAVKDVRRFVGAAQNLADQRTNTAVDLGWTCGT